MDEKSFNETLGDLFDVPVAIRQRPSLGVQAKPEHTSRTFILGRYQLTFQALGRYSRSRHLGEFSAPDCASDAYGDGAAVAKQCV